MTKLSWFRRLVLATLCVALMTTLPLPMFDLWFRSQAVYAAPQSGQAARDAFSIVGEGGNPLSEAMETMQGADLLPPELSSSWGMFGANGEPEGVLMDVGAYDTALNRAPTEPDSLANPISISRAQSAYQPGDAIDNTLLITFTVTNNRPPAVVPQVPASATITDSIAIMAQFDYSNDPNTMRNVMVVDELTANGTFLASSPLPDQNGATNAWNLGDIAPLSSTSFTLTLQVPASVSDFTNLDTGATAWGTLQGRQVSAQSSPATLTPEVINGENIGDWLKWTVDADIYDEYMLQKAAEIGQAPETLFAYVRSLGYESYSGSLRGTRGTIWSEAGNSLDQASLLIAMLRTSGIPARYRHGTLEPARAQELILSMFPEPTRVIGHIPEGTVVSDPANDPQLLAETEDHWWVEAYIPAQGWTDLDPSFPNAAIGERFVTDGNIANDGTDKIAEAPDNLRHKVTLKLKVEEYNPLNVGGTETQQLEHSYPLTHTFNTVELVGNPVTLGHLVNSTGAGGLIGSTIKHTYVPYFLVGDEVIQGNPYQDVLSGIFGSLSNWVHTAVWLTFEVQDAAGNVETYEREIVDLIGFEARQGGGNAGIQLPEGNPPLLSETNMHQVMFGPSKVPASALNTLAQPLIDTSQAMFALLEQRDELDEDDDTQQALLARAATNAYRLWGVQALNAVSVSHYSKSDEVTEALASGMLIKSYAAAPRLIISSMDLDAEGTFEMTLDLLGDYIIAHAYPSQNIYMVHTFQNNRGYMESYLEGLALESMTGRTARTTHNVFEAWRDLPDADIIAVTSDNLDELEQANISDEAKGRIVAAVQAGKVVITPNQMVSIDGVETIGWWENDPQTGAIEGVMEDGLHSSLISYSFLLQRRLNNPALAIIGFLHGMSYSALSLTNEVLMQANCVADPKCEREAINIKEALSKVMQNAFKNFIALIASIKSRELKKEAQPFINLALEEYKNGTFLTNPSVIFTILFQFNLVIEKFAKKHKFSLGVDFFNLGHAVGQIAAVVYFHLTLDTDPPLPGSLIAISPQNLFQNQVSVPISSPTTYPNDTLSASLTAPSTAISSTVGSASFYAPALSGMGFGGDGSAYGAANYADSAAFQAQGANLMIGGPVGGALQVGSESVSVPNGVAIAGYSANVSITEASATTDQVELASSQADFFTLDLSADTSTTNPVTAITFQANISANFDDTYTMTVEGPDGWHVEIDTTGVMTATPPLGAAEGAYTILVVAQSSSYPDLFVSALHAVTVTSYEGMELSVNPDLLITMPWGPRDPNTIPGGTNNGQMQITGAAFTGNITNTSTIAHEFTLSVSGLPDGWLVLSGEEGQSETTMTLPAGGIGQVGLYISPTLTTLPPVGTEYPFTVEAVATDNAALSATDDESFTVPGIAFSQLEASPVEIYSSPGLSTTFDLSVRNVGNMTGAFPLSVTRPISTTWTAQYNTPLSLDAGEANTQAVTLLTPDGEIGEDYVVSVESPSGAYTQIASVVIRLVGPNGQCAYQAAAGASELDNVPLASAVESLAQQMAALELDLADLDGRDQVVSAIEEVIGQLANYPAFPVSASLQEIAQTMPTHSEAAEISADLAALCDALTGLNILVTAQQEHGVSVRVTPGLNAALPGQTVPYTLTISNQGTQPTSYAATLTSTLLTPSNYTTTLLAPGGLYTIPLTVTPTALGFYTIDSSVVAIGEEELLQYIQADTTAGLNVVDAFVRILQVTADPSFVETGVSSTTLSVDVANIANIYLPANARTQILAENGSTQWSDQKPLGLRTGASRTYNLGTVDTSGWASGTYTVTVDLLDDSNTLIPDGSAQTYLLVGQGLQASHAVDPAIVAPGTVTVTTLITTTAHQAVRMAQARQPSRPSRAVTNVPLKTAPTFEVDSTIKNDENALPKTETSEDETSQAEEEQESKSFGPEQTSDEALSRPFMPSPVFSPTGIIRYEEDNPLISYSGNWSTFSIPRASNGQTIYSNSAGDTATFTFTGTWVGLGFATNINSGQVELFIDGVSQGIIDSYTRDEEVVSYYYDGLSAGSHTMSLTVLGSSNPNASDAFVVLDYIDVWDGTQIPNGTFEHDSDRVRLSANWLLWNDQIGSGGSYVYSGSNAWFAFTGDSVSFQAIAGTGGDEIEILIDGQKVDRFDLYHSSIITRTFSFDGLGAGPHVLQVNAYRGTATVDAFMTPGSAPFYEPPTATGVVRYEEDDPALRYNGLPFQQTAQSWNIGSVDWASRGYTAWSETLSDTVSLTFTGPWVSLGFLTASNGGMAEVFIDGVSQGVIDSYSASNDVLNLYYDGLTSTTHTISVTVLSTSHPSSTGQYIYLDYIDVWDGTPMSQGRFNENDARVHRSSDWQETSSPRVNGDAYIEDGSNVWFLFTGNEATYVGVTDQNTATRAEVFIDGVSQGVVDLNYTFSRSPVPFHYTNLGAGAHVMRIKNIDRAGVDAFDTSNTPFAGIPMVEWYDTEPSGDGGMASTIAAGDINNDGTVELVASSYNRNIYVYAGDGTDTGNGSPLHWSYEVGLADSPAIADLDGDGFAEVLVTSDEGFYIFDHEGNLLHLDDSLKSYLDLGLEHLAWGGAAIANMDDDPQTEIVLPGDGCPCVLEADGTVVKRYGNDYGIENGQTTPTLADITGDGTLDIITAYDEELYLIDYANDTLVWTRTFLTPTFQLDTWGPPAVADVDGDNQPEIIMAWGGYVEVLNTDGTLKWSYATGGARPSPVSVSDTDGDGEVEIVATMWISSGIHRIHVLNHDGSLLWSADAGDSTFSTSGTSIHDLDGDGDWEVIWNGYTQGLTVYDGSDGTILFNEPTINSGTIVEYPIVVDVDGDGHAEIVTGDTDGLYVVGYDGGWAPSRSIWNQYDYHITNIKNDLTVPGVEPDSWAVHNTYRTQTPIEDPFAGYQVDLTHTIASSGMAVLTDTFSAPPDTPAPRGAYHWSYEQLTPSSYTTSFDAVLPDMQPGEVRQISQGTVISYQLPSGFNQLALPPLYVEAAHIIAIEPVSQTITIGSRAIYDVTLSNPGTTPATYSLAVNGLPEGWANLPTTINLDPESEITLPMTVTVPTGGELGEYDFAVTVNNGLGGTDQASATLIVADLLDILVSPDLLFATAGEVVTYTVTITNAESVARTYALTHSGLDGNQVTLPDTLSVAANSSTSVPLVVQAYAKRGIHLFTVHATTVQTGVSSQDDAVLEILNDWQVAATLTPPVAKGGPGTTVAYTLTVTNTGSVSDTYDLAVSLPDGWSYRLQANGTDLDTLSLTPYVFNSANLTLLVTPATTATPGNYDIRATIQSQSNPDANAIANAVLEVTPYGVQVAISPASVTLEPTQTGTWDVTVTNTGDEADTYDLIATGIVAGSARFEPATVSLAAGESQTVQLSADILEFALRQSYQFSAIARSTTQEHIQNQDSATITFQGYEAVEVQWRPTTQTVTDSLSAAYMLVITNTGNVDTTYQLSLSDLSLSRGARAANSNIPTALNMQLEVNEVYIPPHMTAGILATVQADGPGTYTFEGTASSNSSSTTNSATATLIIPGAAGITITPTTLNVSEGGTTDSYQVVLTSEPTDSVSIVITTDAQTTVNLSTLTFDATNWQTPQSVTVSAVDDSVVEGTHSSTITHGAVTADPNYNIAITNVIATITDNDTPPTATATNTPVVPTNTPVVPTNTPTATVTPTPTPTRTATPIPGPTNNNIYLPIITEQEFILPRQ
ncbi:MAG: FG-GAP-like repeat-containing protein [Ardenticatenaceae bacterium]